MKALPKRKGNTAELERNRGAVGLNESPSQKEGKCLCYRAYPSGHCASMKALPKRKGNRFTGTLVLASDGPQ